MTLSDVGQPAANSDPTPSARVKSTLGSLEIGRFIAASMVVLTHWLPTVANHAADAHATIFGGLQMPGAIATQYFFVLSGFVMMTAHRGDFGKLSAVPRFWWRRACRIYPMYWVALACVMPFLYGGLTPGLAIRLISLAPVTVADWVSPAWTLRYEIAFYVIFGLVLLPYVGRPLLALWVLCVAWMWCPGFVLTTLHIPPPYFLNGLSIRYISFFLAPFEFYFFGGLLGGWIFTITSLQYRANLLFCIAGALVLAAALPVMSWGYGYGPPLLSAVAGIGFAMAIVGMSGLEKNGVLRFGPAARRLGAMSYPLYILHHPLMLFFDIYAQKLKLPVFALYLLTIAGLVGVYIISAIFAFFVDQPLQRRLRQVFGRGPSHSHARRNAELKPGVPTTTIS